MPLLLASSAAVQAQFNYTTTNGTVTITGYTGPGGSLTIPDRINDLPVTSIGPVAFSRHGELSSITVPNSVVNIDFGAFADCWGLASFTIPNSVTNIGDVAFRNCTTLTNITIPNSVISIGWGAFYQCTSLSAISVDTLNAFYSSADGVLFDHEQRTLIQYPGGRAGNYTIPNSVTRIAGYAFAYCTLASVTLPDSTTNIEAYTFQYSASLTNVSIGNGVSNIGDSAFYHCTALTSVTLPNGLTVIGNDAFDTCIGLASVSIPNSVTNIGNSAFRQCAMLTSVTIPASVTSLGSAAFSECAGLTAIKVEALNPVYSSVDGVLFNKSQTTLIQYPGGGAPSYTIPYGLTSIGSGAFEGCSNLTTVTLPSSVTSIDAVAFANCVNLRSVYCQGNAPEVGWYAFAYDFLNFSVHYISATVYYWPGTTGWTGTLGNLQTVLLSLEREFICITNNGAITVTGYNGPAGAVTIPSNINGLPVTGIGDSAFNGRSDLVSITLPNGITYIGRAAFFNCTSLTNVTIGNSLTSIADEAFASCSKLVGVYFQGNAPSLGSDVFLNDNNLTIHYLPGTTGWGLTFGGRPTALQLFPNQLILSNGPGSGAQTNGFGFTIFWATPGAVVIEVCTNFANPTWFSLQTNSVNDVWSYFSDPGWTNYSTRFYRVRSL